MERLILEVSAEVESLAESTGPYHHRFRQLIDAVRLTQPAFYCAIACRLGALALVTAAGPTLADSLRLELSDELLKGANRPASESTIEEVRSLLASWRNSSVEEIRMRGIQTTKFLEQHPEGRKWFKTEN